MAIIRRARSGQYSYDGEERWPLNPKRRIWEPIRDHRVRDCFQASGEVCVLEGFTQRRYDVVNPLPNQQQLAGVLRE